MLSVFTMQFVKTILMSALTSKSPIPRLNACLPMIPAIMEYLVVMRNKEVPTFFLVFSLALLPFPSAAEESGSLVKDPNVIEISEALARQLKIEPVGYGHIYDTLRLPGRVQLDEQRLVRIGASVTGRITDLHALLGQEVQQGDVLAELNSIELGTAQAAYLTASSQANL